MKQSWRKFQDLKTSARQGFSKRVQKVEGATVNHARNFIIDRWNHLYEVRRNIGMWLCGLGVLIFIMIAQFTMLNAGYVQSAPVRGGTYAEGMVGDISTLNPIYATSTAEVAASRLMFSSLFRYDDKASLSGDLATGYKVDETGKIYTVSLHDKAKWHDGNKLTVDDVIFTLDTLKKPSAGTLHSEKWRNVEYKKLDDYNMQFILPASYTPFPNALTFPIIPKHILADVPPTSLREHKFSNSPVGSGPFVFSLLQRSKEEKKHTVLHSTRNANYYLGNTNLERFQLHVYGERSMLVDALKRQAINSAADVAIDDYLEIVKDPRFKGYSPTMNAGVYAIFNTDSPLLTDVGVRTALRYGLSTESIRKSLGFDAKPMHLPILNEQVSSIEGFEIPNYNQDKANEMLDSLGWVRDSDGIRKKNGQALEVKMSLKKDPEYQRVAQVAKDQWREIGVNVELNVIDTSDPTQNFASLVLQPRDFDILIHDLSIGADPDVYAYWHSSQAVARGLNFANYKDGLSDDSLISGRSRPEANLRDAKYRAFVARWLRQVPAIGIYRSPALYVTLGNVSAVNSDMRLVTSADRYYGVNLWTTRTDSVYKTP